MSNKHEITKILQEWQNGDKGAINRLFPLVYDELYRMAQHRLRNERRTHTLSTTALVNEAYFELVDQSKAGWNDRAHFLAFASLAMRRVLVNWARKHNAQKRGGGKKAI